MPVMSGNQFTHVGNLMRHILILTRIQGKKHHVYYFFGKQYTHAYHLKYHMSIHTGLKLMFMLVVFSNNNFLMR